MENLINQFVHLPSHITSALSSAEAIEKLEKIENAYNVSLADIVMRVALKKIQIAELEDRLQAEFGVSYDASKKIKEDLTHNIFSLIANHLGMSDVGTMQSLSASEGASLGVDDRDTEIAHHKSLLKYIEPQQGSEYDTEALVVRLEKTVGVALDHVMHKRLKKIVESRLVDARDLIAFKEQLERSEKIGGMGLQSNQIDALASIVESEWKKVHDYHLHIQREENVPRIPKTKKTEVRPQHPNILMQKAAQPTVPPQQTLQPASRPVVPQPQPAPQKPVGPPPVQKLSVAKAETPKAEPTPTPRVKKPDVPHFMPRMQRQPVETQRATVDDIKRPSKLVGPVEELEQMTIKDFRNLSEDLKESATRIEEKIRHLEKESFQLRSQGVKAWRSSPLMQEYLAIGRESMETGKNVRGIITQRASLGEKTMSEDEFETIGSLNNIIRF